jgi:hypothetical protein
MKNNIFYTDPAHGKPLNNNWILPEDGDFVYAKEQYEFGTTKYFIKTDTSYKLYNPFSVYDNKLMIDQNNHVNFLNKICKKNKHKYVRVNQKCFELYLTYIRNKNTSWLLQAQRELE